MEGRGEVVMTRFSFEKGAGCEALEGGSLSGEGRLKTLNENSERVCL